MERGLTADWRNRAMVSGLVGGLAMASYLMAVLGILGQGFFTPMNLVAAVFPPFRPVLSGFHPAAAFIGMAIHLGVATLWGLVLGTLQRKALPDLFNGTWSQSAVGLALGFIAWMTTGLRIGPAIDPALGFLPASHAFIAHLVFGIATATVLWAWAGSAPALRARPGPLRQGGGLGVSTR
ncbi:MAG: conserved hypothetical rane spanning protein [Fibrobacteres bacterium]|nr:conserved hypothetical rane spanning protein [Fibrobacterota bacterium]